MRLAVIFILYIFIKKVIHFASTGIVMHENL